MSRFFGLRIGFISFIILAGLALIAAPGGAAKLAGTDVKIGYINPFSGWGSYLGKDNQIAVNLAVKKINASGGIGGLPLKIIKYDSGSRGEQAISVMRRLANSDKVLAVLGPYISSNCEVVFPVANRIGIVAVSSASAAPGIAAKNRPWTFRNTMTSERVLEPGFKVWVAMHKPKNVALGYDTADFLSKTEATKVFPQLIKKYGMNLVETVTWQTGNLDFSPQVTKLKKLKLDGIVVASLNTEAANFARELRRQGMKQPITSGVGTTAPEYPRLGRSSVEGTISAQPFWPGNPDPRVQAFVKAYTENSGGKLPPHYSANIYDNLFIMKMAIETSGVTNKPQDLKQDRVRIRRVWERLKDYNGIAGLTSMGPDGDARKHVYVMKVTNGAWKNLK